jgi:glycosyltransferase involved in cell wall biosynthesis
MMQNSSKIAVIIPFLNEELFILSVISSLPSFVDYVVLIDDGSTDKSVALIQNYFQGKETILFEKDEFDSKKHTNQSVFIIQHLQQKGKGAGIKTGYEFCKKLSVDCIATMDGDGQMHPDDLEAICLPVIQQQADYAKGNRLSHPDAFKIIPIIRYFGNVLLSFTTKICSGYWHINDSQTGFTAINQRALHKIDIHKIYDGYGCENDVLVKLNIINAKVVDVPIRPVYHSFENSKLSILDVIPKLTILLFRLFFYRIWMKYFHGFPKKIQTR